MDALLKHNRIVQTLGAVCLYFNIDLGRYRYIGRVKA